MTTALLTMAILTMAGARGPARADRACEGAGGGGAGASAKGAELGLGATLAHTPHPHPNQVPRLREQAAQHLLVQRALSAEAAQVRL